MNDAVWYVTVDGTALEGHYSPTQIRALTAEYAGRGLLVWREGMAEWMDPSRLPEFLSPPPPPAHPAGRFPEPPAPETPAGTLPGFFQALADMRFNHLVTLRILGGMYLLVMVLAGILLLFLLYTGFAALINGVRFQMGGLVFRGVLTLVLAPLVSLLVLALSRVLFEGILVLFKIRENTEHITSHLK